MKQNVRYDADQRAKAKADKSVLFTIDIDGQHAGRGRSTIQGFLETPAEVEKVYAFFREMIRLGRNQGDGDAEPGSD